MAGQGKSISPESCLGLGSKAGRLGDAGLSRAAGSSVLYPCQPTALPRLGVDQQMDGISSANKQPWPQAQRTQLFLTAAGVQLPQRLKKH